MKYLPLILAGLWRKPARTIFTFLSIVVAFILFGILSAIDGGLAHQLEVARLDRLLVDTQTLGYSDVGVLMLVLAESVILCLLAAVAGLAIAKFGIPRIGDISPDLGQLLLMPWSALLTGLGFALLVAVIAGVVPAWRAKRLSIVNALAKAP
jgi:putative ABC transport system permease protein